LRLSTCSEGSRSKLDMTTNPLRPGKLLVITGPSGVGKGTLVEQLLERVTGIKKSVSVTTRGKRGNEKEGKDYFFRSVEEFKAMEKDHKFME